jgi:hypothetical protein
MFSIPIMPLELNCIEIERKRKRERRGVTETNRQR